MDFDYEPIGAGCPVCVELDPTLRVESGPDGTVFVAVGSRDGVQSIHLTREQAFRLIDEIDDLLYREEFENDDCAC